jgi:superfamily II DNA or RNA helicase
MGTSKSYATAGAFRTALEERLKAASSCDANSWKGTLQQYVGRLHRLYDNKRVVEVYDYVDPNVRMLARMYDRRLRGYADMGYKISKSMAVGAA